MFFMSREDVHKQSTKQGTNSVVECLNRDSGGQKVDCFVTDGLGLGLVVLAFAFAAEHLTCIEAVATYVRTSSTSL